MKKLHYLLIASSLNIIIANISPNYAKNNAEYLCSNGSSTALCKAELNNDALTLTLKDGKRLTARRLGNWKQNNTGGGVERSCNVRIDLGNDFVYGLLKVNSKQGTSLIWPQRQINIRNLKDWKKWTVIIKRNYTPNCHSPFNFQKQDGERMQSIPLHAWESKFSRPTGEPLSRKHSDPTTDVNHDQLQFLSIQLVMTWA